LSDGQKKRNINIFGSFMEPFNYVCKVNMIVLGELRQLSVVCFVLIC